MSVQVGAAPTPEVALGALSFADAALEAAVRRGLDDVERLLHEHSRSAFPAVAQVARHLIDAGGKRFRPLVVLLAAQVADPLGSTLPAVHKAAAAIELTHLSTLYHDDVMDEAPVRRGAESANHRWTNTVAIITGDFLFARASEITADLGTEATRILARTIAVLCEGQIRETVGPQPGADAVEHHLEVLAQKTGSLIATSGRLGALLAGAAPGTVEVLARYGELIGVAFQISDDLIDVASETGQSGKTPGTDLREGIATLPVLYALASPALSAADERLHELLRSDLTDDVRHGEALRLLRAHPAVGQARATLAKWADDARDVLEPLPPSPARAALEALCDVVVRRTG